MKSHEAKRILSIGVAITLLFHGIHKIIYGIDVIVQILHGYNVPFPQYLAYSVFLGEIIAPMLLLSDKFVNTAGVLIFIHMFIGLFFVSNEHLIQVTPYGAWAIETPVLYLIIGATLAIWENETKLN